MLGIPHPPGNPLFVILAHVFGLLPLAESYAVRINLFAAVTSAGGGRVLVPRGRALAARASCRNRWARFGAALGGVLVGATSWTVWNQSTVNEKVYTVSLLSIALVMWLVVRWGDDEPGAHRDRWLVLIAYVLALTRTNHLMGLLAVPALLVYVLLTDWRVVVRPWAIVTFYALLLAVSGKWLEMFQGGDLQVGAHRAHRSPCSATRSGAPRGIRWSIWGLLAVVVGHLAQLPLAAVRARPSTRRSTRASRSACSARR